MVLPVAYSINGFMGQLFAGPQWDVAKYLEDQRLVKAQPVGYNCTAFPLSIGVADGLREIKRLIREVYPGTPFVVASWSEGAIIWCELLEAMRSGDMADVFPLCRGAVTFGNPYREAGSWAPKTGVGAVPDPGGAGIGGVRNNTKSTPAWQHDYAHTGDIYTCCATGPVGDDQRIIFDFVLTQWGGAIGDLWAEAQELLEKPGQAVTSIIGAITQAIAFYGGQQRPHQNYDPHPAMNYLAGILRTGVQPGGTPTPQTGGTMTTPVVAVSAAKALTAVVGAVLNIVATVATSGALPPQWSAIVTGVIGLLTAFGVYQVPNKPK